MDFMDKTNAFLEKLEESGISISNQDGETAVICEDCVAVISKSGDRVLSLVAVSVWNTLNDPTTKGLGDSERAKSYTDPQ